MKKILTLAVALILVPVFTACNNPIDDVTEEPPVITTGTITGKALYTNSSDNSGITITLERTDGLRSVFVAETNRSITNGNFTDGARSVSARSITGQTTTAADGSFTLTDIPAGAYTLYASSKNSLEKAVTTSVNVQADQVSDAGTLTLTPVGTISGKIVVDDGESDMFGFLVSVAGTSFMAVTGFDGEYKISGVPAGDNYFIIVMKGNFTGIYKDDDGKSKSVSVSGGEDTTLDNIVVTTEELNIETRITIGDNGNWFIDGKDTGVQAQGEKGVDGKDGADGKDGTVITISEDGYWMIDGEKTNVKAQGLDGLNGAAGTIITISSDGYWIIDGEKSDVKARGLDGTDGTPGTVITISSDGFWVIDGIKTNIRTYCQYCENLLTGKLLILQANTHGNDNGGAAGFSNSLVELYNNTHDEINLSDSNIYLHIGNATSWTNAIKLEGVIPAKSSFLVASNTSTASNFNATPRAFLPAADQTADFVLVNNNFKVAVMINMSTISVDNPFTATGLRANYIDMLGVGTANGFETQAASTSRPQGPRRTSLIDTDNNSNDFTQVDYRGHTGANGMSDNELYKYWPRNSASGAWNPITGLPVTHPTPFDPNITANTITSFKFLKDSIGWEEDLLGVIDQSAKTITFTTQRWINNIDKLSAVFETDNNGIVLVDGTPQWSGITTNDFRKDVIYVVGGNEYTVRFVSPQATGLPVIRIDTQGGAAIHHSSTGIWTTMTFSLSDPNNPANDISAISNQEIRGRGNWSWNQPKKPHRIRFANNQQQSPFELPAARNWVLLANYGDPSLIRTSFAFKMGHRLGLECTPSFNHVEFFLNGIYQGSYLFTEHRQALNIEETVRGRVAVDASAGGWLVVFDIRNEEPRFSTTNYNLPITVQTPEVNGNNINDPVFNIVKSDWENLTALMASADFPENGYRDLIDMDSWIRHLLVRTVTNEQDYEVLSSVFIHRANSTSPIKAGPLWDFDKGFRGWPTFFSVRSHHYPTQAFFNRFLQDSLFRARWKEIWNENREWIRHDMYDFIISMEEDLRKSAAQNDQRWVTGPNGVLNTPNEIVRMKTYFTERFAFLDNEYNKVDILPASRNFETTTTQTITLVAYGVITNLSATLQKDNDSPFEIVSELTTATRNGGYLVTISVKPKDSLSAGTHTDALVLSGTNQGNEFSHNVTLTFSQIW